MSRMLFLLSGLSGCNCILHSLVSPPESLLASVCCIFFGYCSAPENTPFFFFFWLPNPPLLIQFARGIWASVSKSVSYVFPQRPVSFVNICLAAGISGPHRTSSLTFAASFCCISHLELRLCSLCVLENAGVRVHILSRYCRECTHLIRP